MIKTTGKFYTDTETAINVGSEELMPLQTGIVSNNCIVLKNNIVYIKTKGLYRISYNATLVATADCVEDVRLQANSVDVLGAKSKHNVHSGDTVPISFETLLTVQSDACPCKVAELSIKNMISTSVIVSNLIVEKIA